MGLDPWIELQKTVKAEAEATTEPTGEGVEWVWLEMGHTFKNGYFTGKVINYCNINSDFL